MPMGNVKTPAQVDKVPPCCFFEAPDDGFDMVKTLILQSGNVADVIFERLLNKSLKYDYLFANPVKLVPSTAESRMPAGQIKKMVRFIYLK